jgi:hypothetical protein
MALNLSTKTWWIWLISGTLLGILIMVLFGKGCSGPKVVKHLIYKSDTIRLTVDKYVHDTLKVPYEVVLPEKVLIYEADSSLTAYDADSNDLAREVGYNPYFLWQFRDRPKFISGRFYEDSLSIQILDTSGAIVIKRYPVDYSQYDYFHNSRELMRVDRPKKPTTGLTISDPIPNITTTGNFYGYYSLIHGGFTVAADYWAIKGKWGLGVLGELNTYPRYGNIKLGVKYQFK